MIDLTKIAITNTQEEQNGQSPKFWTNINGVNYLFKANYFYPVQTKTNFGEVLYTRLGKKLGFPVVESTIARGEINGNVTEGVLVKSFFEIGDTESITLKDIKSFALEHKIDGIYESSVESDMIAINHFAKATNKRFDYSKTELEMYKLAIVDYFLGQGDRHERNIEFILNANNSLRLAPAFDNGHCLAFKQPYFSVKLFVDKLDKHANTQKPFGDNVRLSLKSHYNDHCKTKNCSDTNFIFDMINLSNHNSEIKEFITNILNLDIKQELDDLEKESNAKIDDEYKRLSNEIFKNRCENFLLKVSTKEHTLSTIPTTNINTKSHLSNTK